MSKIFVCAVAGDVLAEPDTVVKSMVTRKAVASRTSFTGTSEELEAARASLKRDLAVMQSSGSFPTVTTPIVSAGGAEVTIQFVVVEEPDALLNMSPPPSIVLLSYTPVTQTTLKSLEVLWIPALTQMFARPQVILAGTRVETLAHQKIMDRIGTKPVACETIVDKAASWRAVDYVEVSAACNVHLNTLLNALGMACLQIPARRITSDLAKDQRRECMKPILSTQSVWTYKRHPVTGRVFYGNRITEQSQWTRPADYDGEEPELTPAEREAEEQAKRALEEQRVKEQHERQIEEQTRQEMAVHNERVHELEKRAATLTREVAHVNIRVSEIREVIERNRKERVDLERQHDQITEARFAKSTVDDDLRIEREINDAKVKLFMLEGRVALADDTEQHTAEIAEAMLANKASAQQLRELIAEQLVVRKQGSASHVRIDSLARQQEDASVMLAALTAKAPALKSAIVAAEGELKATEKVRAELTKKVSDLRATLTATDNGAHTRQHHVERLRREIVNLDQRISLISKGVGTTGTTHPAAAEEARVKLEQTFIVGKLADAASSCARAEITNRQKIELLKYAVSEYVYASRKRGEVAGALVEAASRRREDRLQGLTYPISTPYELAQLQRALDERIADLSTTQRGGPLPQPLEDFHLNKTPHMSRHLQATPTRRTFAAFGSTTPTGRTSSNMSSFLPNTSISSSRRGNTPTTTRGNSSFLANSPHHRRGTAATSTPANSTTLGSAAEAQGTLAQLPSLSAEQRAAIPASRLAAITELEQIKAQLLTEQSFEEAAEALAQLCRTAEQRAATIRAKGTQQHADLCDALEEALRQLKSIERLGDYQTTSPLERLVAIVDEALSRNTVAAGSVSLSASSRPLTLPEESNAHRSLSSERVIAEIANLFTEKMLNAMPQHERAAVAQSLNAAAINADGRNLSRVRAVDAVSIANAVTGVVPAAVHEHAVGIDTAARRGVVAAVSEVLEATSGAQTHAASRSNHAAPQYRDPHRSAANSAAHNDGDGNNNNKHGYGDGQLPTASLAYLAEKARRLERRRGASAAQYTQHAERTKKILNVMQPLTAAERDDIIRAQHRYFKKR